jgi:hypothetical protein
MPACPHMGIRRANRLRGVMLPSTQEPTEDGYDLSFGTNALGRFE